MLNLKSAFVFAAALFAVACTDNDGVASAAEAKKAYLALDPAIAQAIDLGFQGFAAATSANIAPQTAAGAKAGTLTVAGKVDQGTSTNKNMDLNLGFVGWSSDAHITFNTPKDEALQPKLSLALKKLPDGDMTGTLTGDFAMTGDLAGAVALNLALTGKMQADAAGKPMRKPGTTHITGTATSHGASYAVDVLR